ncbi:MAG: Fic family protein [Gemmatimonas sp.]|nr:Fic family protein [Gemmatimonas sp.]
MPSYKWERLEPLSPDDRSIDLAAIRPLYESWHTLRKQLKESSPGSLTKFSAELVRRLSVETGIIERIYDVDRGTTEVLVEAGFREDLVARSGTDVEPARLITILKDHEAAIQLVMDCVGQSRALTKGLMHELHATLTRHHETTVAVDQFGKHFEVPLQHGKFKDQPNNPARPDGIVHEYCPPVHVDAEVDRLLSLIEEYQEEDPIIVAAWSHHRFTQIHPYQDGNGRVGRTLTTMHLLQHNLLPLVVDRDLRPEYLDALEAADFGDLTALAQLFARLQRNAILQALSIDTSAVPADTRSLSSSVIDSIGAKLAKKQQQKHIEYREVNNLALALRGTARLKVQATLNALKESVAVLAEPDIHIRNGGPDQGNSHWYKFDVIKSSERSGKFVNFTEDHYFLKSTFRLVRERLVFVVSFHHVGRELTGIMEATSFARLESFEGSDDRESIAEEFTPCSLEPFVITWQTEQNEIRAAFERWLDSALAVAIKEFGDRL